MRVPGLSFSLAIGCHRFMNSGNMYMTTTVASPRYFGFPGWSFSWPTPLASGIKASKPRAAQNNNRFIETTSHRKKGEYLGANSKTVLPGFGCRVKNHGSLHACGLLQSLSFVRFLPGEIRQLAPKMPIASRFLVNRPPQVERLNDALGRQFEI